MFHVYFYLIPARKMEIHISSFIEAALVPTNVELLYSLMRDERRRANRMLRYIRITGHAE